MPQLQKWCGEVSGVCGIYRLKVIGEEKEICYVGQAKDIKER
nr:MAG TPA: UvrABC system protein C [Caudoviricetes sp.]